ncbi:MAG: GspE/PulE family protein [Candidatus Nucleicultricaceae bacterium]
MTKSRDEFPLQRSKFSFDLTQHLKKLGIVSEDRHRIACIEQQRLGLSLEEAYIKLGFITEELLRDILTHSHDFIPFCGKDTTIDQDLLNHWPMDKALAHQIMPLCFKDGTLDVVMTDGFNIQAIDSVKSYFPNALTIIRHIALRGEFKKIIETFYDAASTLDKVQSFLQLDALTTDAAEKLPTFALEFVENILSHAIDQNASDLHFEVEPTFVRTRLRIDGLLQPLITFHKKYWPSIVVRLKVMADLNIAETRHPQNGRASLTLHGRSIDLRISMHPTLHGEDIVVRILDQKVAHKNLEELGFTPTQLSHIKNLASHPEGMILVTGPTGSGKTTTLYGILNYLLSSSLKIMTLEQPIEYTLPQVRQTSIHEDHGITFGDGVRSVLRQDPDVIMIGEIRDETTSQMAFRASLTGHLVLSSLHTKDCFGSLFRLKDLGMSLDLIGNNVLAIIAQRLVRKLCSLCKMTTDEIHFEPKGCPSCHYTGYKGRTIIAEIVPMNTNLENAILEGKLTSKHLEASLEATHQSIHHHATLLIKQGITSLEEVRRVIHYTPDHHAAL